MRYGIWMLAVLACAASPLAASGEDGPKPEIKAYGEAKNDLPLELYQKLRRQLDAYRGLEVAGEKLTKGDAEKALQEDAKANQEKLVQALQASQVIHRELSARVLQFASDKQAAVKGLAAAVGADPDTDVRTAVVSSLGELADATGVEPLIQGLADGEEAVRGLAVEGLGKIKDPRAAAPLLKTLSSDAKPAVRMKAAGALKDIKDSKSLEALAQALNAEQDYRVKMAIASAIRDIRGQETPHTKDVPTTEEHGGDLSKLSREMQEIEEKLRADRHDQAVQGQQEDVAKQLAELIKKVEEMQQQGQGQGQGQQQQQQQQQQQGQGQQSGPKQAGSPLADSQLGGNVARGALQEAQVSGHQDDWAQLPPAMRDEMLQTYREGFPERWRKRLQAYFASVAAEEEKR